MAGCWGQRPSRRALVSTAPEGCARGRGALSTRACRTAGQPLCRQQCYCPCHAQLVCWPRLPRPEAAARGRRQQQRRQRQALFAMHRLLLSPLEAPRACSPPSPDDPQQAQLCPGNTVPGAAPPQQHQEQQQTLSCANSRAKAIRRCLAMGCRGGSGGSAGARRRGLINLAHVGRRSPAHADPRLPGRRGH